MIRLRREGLGFRRISNYLNDHAYPPKHGLRWTDGTVRTVLMRVVPELCPPRVLSTVPQEHAAAHVRDQDRQRKRRASERSESSE